MSVDFNSMINKALSDVQQRKALGNSLKNLEGNSVSKANETQTGGELSVEDIANAMKVGRLKREDDNKFISTNGNSFKVNREKDDKLENNLSPMSIKAQEQIITMQNKISSIKENSQVATDRQNILAQSMRAIQKDPFAK
ncbi:MAG: hypothetical protein U0354_07510 [Candidatus Sericytochromatia bacterium]